nr:septum site-determining protein MinC [Maliibacterium massiliense]
MSAPLRWRGTRQGACLQVQAMRDAETMGQAAVDMLLQMPCPMEGELCIRGIDPQLADTCRIVQEAVGRWFPHLTLRFEAPRSLEGAVLCPRTDAPARTLVLQGGVRSGQVVRAPGDILVLGNVNAGARLIAGGNIAVMGCLRGLAHAGAGGRTDVCVTASSMQAGQLRIAGRIALCAADAGPHCARLAGEHIVLAPVEGI